MQLKNLEKSLAKKLDTISACSLDYFISSLTKQKYLMRHRAKAEATKKTLSQKNKLGNNTVKSKRSTPNSKK